MSLDEVIPPENQANIESRILIDTQHPVEKITVDWRVSNYSKIFNDDVWADFHTTSRATSWRLKLKKPRIYLYRLDEGDPVNINYECVLKTRNNRNFRCTGWCTFDRVPHRDTIFDIADLETYETTACFDNDVLNFQCTMAIFGHAITNTVSSTNFSQETNKVGNLLKSREHCDVTVSVGGGKDEIPAQKAILCAPSPVFNMMFQHEMLESESRRKKVEDVDFDTLQDFVSFLYSGKLENMFLDKAMKLYYVADKYQVRDLREACSKFLQLNLSADEAWSVLKLADRHRDEELKKTVEFFIKMHLPSEKPKGLKRFKRF